MSDPFDYLDMNIVGWSTKYDCVTLHRRPIFGSRQKYRKVFYAWVETRKDTTDVYKLKSKSDSKGQATDEARLLFKDYHPNRWRTLHVKEELVPVKHRQKKRELGDQS